ncbi:hypothetical protein [Jannaschia seohaensis]|uniref:Cation/multidrug efflux pump n=1 Tax=Jannaschia seohaensis TaxID=475081 RepID=A0A2Y9B877_9RHOB|nr:hypothetical protein [Jannaschia seohaensis]PWJ12084.1 hypothetical protein BCF38_11715 [Jannaschia seohaensis]SSA51187.1 hypothetical protein SAMN05421539_11715 [Jannaschia seohaensis]
MIPISRLLLVLVVALTVVFVSLWFYFRAGERERLAEQWAREQPPLPEHTHIENGLRAYEGGLRRKLILGVYVVPLALVIGTSLILNSL